MKKILLLFFGCCFLQIVEVFAKDDSLIKNVSVITMESDRILEHTDVLLSGGRITSIGQGLSVDNPDMNIIDGKNKYLMPGLADMHMHFWGDSTALRLYLANGVTTIRCMSGKPEYIKWRKEIDEGKKIGPQLYCNGPLMNDVNFIASYMPLSPRFIFFGIPVILFSGVSYSLLRFFFRKGIKTNPKRTFIELGLPIICIGVSYAVTWLFCSIPQVAGEEVCLFAKNWEVRKAVREQAKIGYDAIKPYTSMTHSEFTALMEEANRQNIPVVGHIPASVCIDDVINYKMAGLAHVEELRYQFYKGYDFSGETIPYDKIDTTGLDNITRRLKNANIFVVSSLIPCKEYIDRRINDSTFNSRPEMKYFPLKTLSLSKKEGFRSRDQYPDKEYWLLTSMFKSCHKNGVRIVLGTDSRWTNDVHGFTVHDELKLLVENGLSNYEALQAATKNAAISVHAFNEWGSVSEGKIANLLVLDKNPLEHIENTKSISGVFLKGTWYDHKALENMLLEIYEYNRNNDRIISARP
ncbi:MAG: amidohydrolase family protein [Bacteroidota bacterium]|jgi:imidazolonepropionase-like amidohydrolase